MKILIIDNYDSFTYNLFQLIAEINNDRPIVIKNDKLSFEEFNRLAPELCVISPGPGSPENERDFGICRGIIEQSRYPVLGVCLGHQGIGHFHGAQVVHANEPYHGRLSSIFHDSAGAFQGIPQGFSVVRYHSLILRDPLPDVLEKTAWTSEGVVMGLRHKLRPMWGVQFHPESVCTQYGRKLLDNVMTIAQQHPIDQNKSYFDTPCVFSSTENTAVSDQTDHPDRYRVYSRKLNIFPDCEEVFSSLFGTATHSFWLDSSRAEPPLSRFSFMGAADGDRSEVVQYDVRRRRLKISCRGTSREQSSSIFDYVREVLDRTRYTSPELPFDFNCGLVGYIGYELKSECGGQDAHRSEFPDAQFILADRLIAFDYVEKCIYLVFLGEMEDERPANCWFSQTLLALENLSRDLPPITPEHQGCSPSFEMAQSEGEYLKNIDRAMQFIRNGDSYEVCLTNQIRCVTGVDPFDYYRHLRRVNPAPYSAYLCLDGLGIACSSPERFLKIDQTGMVESKPIKGTVGRGQTLSEDLLLAERLGMDEKTRSENMMIVDLLRNDLGSACAVASICVPKLMQVETYATVHQLVSTVRGQLANDLTAVDCFHKVFPPGSMTGAPKIRTMEHLDALEKQARGIYSGCLGYFGLNGTADFNVVIRTAVFINGAVSFGVGGAIVSMSTPSEEFDEILTKLAPMLRALHYADSQLAITSPKNKKKLNYRGTGGRTNGSPSCR